MLQRIKNNNTPPEGGVLFFHCERYFVLYIYIINMKIKVVISTYNRYQKGKLIMVNNHDWEKAIRFVSKYKSIEDCILEYGTKNPMPSLIMYIYRFRQIEKFGYDMEDLFMEAYTSILETEKQGGKITNLSKFIKSQIVQYIGDGFLNTYRELVTMSYTCADIDRLKPIQKDVDIESILENEIDTSIHPDSYVIIRDYIDYLIQRSYLSEGQKQILFEYFINEKTITEIGKEMSSTRGSTTEKFKRALYKVIWRIPRGEKACDILCLYNT